MHRWSRMFGGSGGPYGAVAALYLVRHMTARGYIVLAPKHEAKPWSVRDR